MIENTASTEEIQAASGAILSIRLWAASPEASPGAMLWEGEAPAAALAMDLIAASEGTRVTTNGSTLVSHFSTIQTAISAARRIQWAVSGFAEAGTPDSANAAILIQSAAHSSALPPSDTLPLEQASAGQILLAETSCRQLQNLPGLLLLPSAHASLRELQWRSKESASRRADDERTLAQLIEQHGLEDPDPPRAEEPPAPARITEQLQPIEPDPASLARTSGEHPAPLRPRQAQFEDAQPWQWQSRLRAVPLWLIAAAAIFLVIALFAVFHGRTPAGPAAQSGPLSAATQPAPNPPVHPSPQAGGPVHAAIPADAKKKDREARKQVASDGNDSHQPQPKPAGACLLNNYEIPIQLDNAAASFQNRRYQEAEKKFRSVLACDPKNARAISGADRAHSAWLLQPASPKQ